MVGLFLPAILWYNHDILVRGDEHMGAVSAEANRNLLNAANFEEFLIENQENMLNLTLSEYLSLQLYQKDLRVADVIRDSGLTKSYVHQIFNGEKKPSRDKLIAVAFGLHLNAEDTQRMIKLGGCSELYPRVARDAAILFSIQHGMSIGDANDLLYDNKFPTLLERE